MNKILIALLLFLTACRQATPPPAAPLLPTETPSPSPVPATATPTATFTPEPTPTPFPRFFTAEFDAGTSMTGWVTLQGGNEAVPNVVAENSRLLIQMDAPYTWAYSLYGTEEYDAVHLSTKFVNSAMSPASAGLVCRYSDTEGWFEYNVTTDGTYNVLYGWWLSSGVADYLPVVNGSSNAIQRSGAEMEIGLICSGTTLTLLIGDTIIRNVDVSRYELAGGRVGMTASSYENTPVVLSFDWFQVSGP